MDDSGGVLDAIEEEFGIDPATNDRVRFISLLENRTELPRDVIDGLDRISRLRESGEVTAEEYRLLESNLMENLSYEFGSQRQQQDRGQASVSGSVGSEAGEIASIVRELSEKGESKIVGALWSLVPEDSYDDVPHMVNIEENESILMFVFHNDNGFNYSMYLNSKEEEDRLREAISEYSYKITDDETGGTGMQSIGFRINIAEEIFKPDLSNDDLLTEAAHLIRLLDTVYNVSEPDLMIEKR